VKARHPDTGLVCGDHREIDFLMVRECSVVAKQDYEVVFFQATAQATLEQLCLRPTASGEIVAVVGNPLAAMSV
jgi:hypothetical protein